MEMMKQGLQVSEVSQVNHSPICMSIPILLQALSEQWKRLSEEEKRHYYREQEHLKELHKLQHPDYKYSPKMVRPSSLSASAPSPPPVSPNQPPEDQEPNQAPPIQVTDLWKSMDCFNFLTSGAAASLSAAEPIHHPVQTSAFFYESASTWSHPSADLHKVKSWP